MPTLFEFLHLPPLLTQFIITALFSAIIGLELHSYRHAKGKDLGFGTTRTFTLIGVLGFVLYMLDEHFLFYVVGLGGLVLLLSIYYFQRNQEKLYSLLSPILAILTYLIAPILIKLPDWFAVLYIVTILVMLGEAPGIRQFSNAFHQNEMITFAKFMVMVGVILPLLPDKQIAPFITVTYYQVWVALLVVSGLSYLSYIAQTYVFKEKGLLLTGLLGGLYSSTATTIVLGRRSQELQPTPLITQALIIATAMMYLRLLLLVFFLGHFEASQQLLLPFMVIFVLSMLATWLSSRIHHRPLSKPEIMILNHPLEFKTALIFAGLFILFTALTSIIISKFGTQGLQVMSFIVGLTDIDPLILSLLSGQYLVTDTQIIHGIIIASASNNLMKAAYILFFERNRYTLAASAWLVFLFLLSMLYVFI